ncbi:Putative 2-hydroxyacid dehydrogenase [Piscirickettsia salmonis]|uniref:S-adenosyl-L-homocysteine hydrolase NAD-binding protein n=1 Tax=Piscirickettsia salmonis TaxID=1238 RepID=A0AAC8VKI0_PISSA|nr:NAD(P)-dependent oxidoreductase [Piscirickettsia salmonis]AKP72378.2 glycerate dehydrogenase [Piscirickettsia salmonis LF-89 = ATCC VR-1361]ALB24170.1 S-adenosyl-L-homocysteine hydrolase NAD-binding protein [Piscirickettsia salmonis]ALY03972.1 glycerate dehydrogenase [Piscirickettsia salmonis]AMA43536.1 glycerate dehydrogenase [Piscirickettsia salmonis]AOS36005.1 glycerate dehydrogenase [Piscirickettsia salmonis]
MKTVFLDQGSVRSRDLDWSKLNDNIGGQFVSYDHTPAELTVERAQGAETLITNKVILGADEFKCLPQLKLVCVAATGVNNIDLVAAKAAGVVVANVPAYSTESVVLYTLSLMLSLYSASGRYHKKVMAGAWSSSLHFCLSDFCFSELAHKTLVIFGYGDIGCRVAEVARALLMNVVIAERPGQPVRQGRVCFEEALKLADILSLHCPLTAETKNLIAAKEFALMKANSYLINVARGGIVNEVDLAQALIDQKIAGAALDVLNVEPPPEHHPLVLAAQQLDNLIITPHVAWASIDARQRLIDEIALNIDAFSQGQFRNVVA